MNHNHHHQHEHQHNHRHVSQRGMYVAAVITLLYAVIEAVVGWWGNSLALLSDAGHMLTDTSALLIAAFGAWLGQRGPSMRHSYGFGRGEFFAALINGLMMLVVVSFILIHAIERMQSPVAVKGEAVSVVAFIGLLLNILILYLLGHAGQHDLNRRAATMHVLSDLLASIAALLSGVVILFTGWTLIDPLLSLLIVAFILFSTLRLLREALLGLMEGVPFQLSLANIGSDMAAVHGIKSVHDLHVWSISPQRLALSAHVVLDDISQWDFILNELRELLLQRYNIDHVTLQPETMTQIVRFEG